MKPIGRPKGRCQVFCVNSLGLRCFFSDAFSLLPQALGVVEKWESWFLDFHFSTPTT